MDKGIKPLELQICQVCNGSGRNKGLSCKECHGAGEFCYFKDNYLFWRWDFGYLHILLRRIKSTVAATINIFLVLLLFVNLFLVYRIGDSVDFSHTLWPLTMIYSFNYLVSWFWILIFFNLYLIYRLMTESGDNKYIEFGKYKKHISGKSINVAEYLSKDVMKALDSAWLVAEKNKQPPLRALHLIVKLMDNRDVMLLFARMGVGIAGIKEIFVKQVIRLLPEKSNLPISQELYEILVKSYISAVNKNHRKILMTDVLQAITDTDLQLQEVLADYGIESSSVGNVIAWIEFQNQLYSRYKKYRASFIYKPKGPINRAYTATATPILDRFGTDMTQLARRGALPLSIGRDKELEQIYTIIESGNTSVLLIGEQGVGKTSIIESLAYRMAAEDVPEVFHDKRLVSLSIPFLVAGASETGELQERLLMITQEVIRSGNIILYIEDIHNLVGVGAKGTENVDLSDVLAMQIKDPRVIVVASTDATNYNKFIEGSSLSADLVTMKIAEPERDEAIQILEANAGYLEAQHNIFFTYGALAKAVDLADRYLHDQFLPAKAVVLMEEVAATVAAKGSEQGKKNKTTQLVVAEDVAAVVSRKTNIPLSQITVAESTRLLNLEETIHQRIVGQAEAVQLVVTALQRARTELRDQKKPIVNLLFLGPTGVGKTELSKAVAESYFGDEEKMIRLDMSEYQNPNSVARLIGVPGSGQGGLLTEQVRANPFALLLLDEMEKAHSDILNIFLQVMEDGRLTDALGRTIDFTNVILIATSNAASQFIQEQVAKKVDIRQIKEELIKDKLKEFFSPEFLNRFDGIIVFKPLTEEEIYQIAGLLLKKAAKRLEIKGIHLTVDPEAQAELAQAGFDPVFGARPLRRVIQDRVDNALAQYLLKGAIGRRDTVILKKGGVIEVDKAKKLY